MKYIDCYLIQIKPSRKSDYLKLAATTAQILKENGAIRTVETWQAATPQDPKDYRATGTQDGVDSSIFKTFNDAAGTKDDEVVVLSWVEWPDEATRDKGFPKAMADPRMHDRKPGTEAFDGRRLIAGSFEVIDER